jgi:hypothetical protein
MLARVRQVRSHWLLEAQAGSRTTRTRRRHYPCADRAHPRHKPAPLTLPFHLACRTWNSVDRLQEAPRPRQPSAEPYVGTKHAPEQVLSRLQPPSTTSHSTALRHPLHRTLAMICFVTTLGHDGLARTIKPDTDGFGH